MQISYLEALVKIAEKTTFTKAAEELHISQPTLSARIQNLENQIGRS